MRYICLTAKHHEGFALFDTQTDDFNSQQWLGRDLVRELAQAAHEHGLMLGLYYSQAQDWEHPGGLWAYRDAPSRLDFEEYLNEKALPQIEELLTQYGPVGLLWLDTPTGMSRTDSQRIADLIRRIQPDCLIGGRIGHQLGDVVITGDNRMPRLALDKAWELPATLNHSWGYSSVDQDWRSPEDVMRQLALVVSRGGNLLLNVGPDGRGQIPPASVQILDRVGEYLKTHGEAFYTERTTPDYPYEQSDFLLTTGPGKLYIHLLRPPRNGRVELYHVENQVLGAKMLGTGEPVDMLVTEDLEGHAYWRLNIPEADSFDIIAIDIAEDQVAISRL